MKWVEQDIARRDERHEIVFSFKGNSNYLFLVR